MNTLAKNAKMSRNVITVRKSTKRINVIKTKEKSFTNASIASKQNIKFKRVCAQ